MAANLNTRITRYMLLLNGLKLIPFETQWKLRDACLDYKTRQNTVEPLIWSAAEKKYVTDPRTVAEISGDHAQAETSEFSEDVLIALQTHSGTMRAYVGFAKIGLTAQQKTELVQEFLGTLLECGVSKSTIRQVLSQANVAEEPAPAQ